MSQTNIADVLNRLRETAIATADPLVAPEDEQQNERLKAYALKALLALLTALIEGRITVQEWERATGVELRRAHTLAYAIGRGRLELLDEIDRARIAVRVREHTNYLAEFADSIVKLGIAAFAVAYLSNRVGMYLNALTASLAEGKARAVGFLLPAYPGDGSTRCFSNCACQWRIVQVGASDWDAYWTLGYVETDHCETCPRRALAWSPIMIRGGVLQPYPRMGLFA